MLSDLAGALREEARAVDERRMLVLAGSHSDGLDAIDAVLDGADIAPEAVTYVGRADVDLPTLAPADAATLLGSTRDTIVFDGHSGLDPNVLGRIVGTVGGGGLFVLLAPSLESWPTERDAFDETLAVPPFAVSDVAGHFRRRFVTTLRSHPGIAIVDIDSDRIERRGLTDPPPRAPPEPPSVPDDHRFDRIAYESCVTSGQVEALLAFETLLEDGSAVVVEADRGRGKSSVAGLAAASLALQGECVVITAPEYRRAAEAFIRAEDLLSRLNDLDRGSGHDLTTGTGGGVSFRRPDPARDVAADVLIVDEAAAISVPLLTDFLEKDRVAFTTTIHGYEGAGRGFSVRFRDRLARSGLTVTDVEMAEPIRYAQGDPIEIWSFRALLLDARPATKAVVTGADPDTVEYRALTAAMLLDDEPLLREVFGLLVLAHYRTEPSDFARLLDAPNINARALLHDGHAVSVALLAREGDLSAEQQAVMYEGGRVRGNMLPDVMASQLRDEAAAQPVGFRVMRIATHAAVRSRGLGTTLLRRIENEFSNDVDWFGVGYGATPQLVGFWARNGYSTIHLSTTRNESSGEHSAIMLKPVTDDGTSLHNRQAAWFARRIPAVLSDALSDLDPDIAVAACRACDTTVQLTLPDEDWRRIAGMAYGPGLIDVDPDPFRELVVKHLVDPNEPVGLTTEQERLLVRKVLQAAPWSAITDELEYPSTRQCMRALGAAVRPLVDTYGNDVAAAERDRYDAVE